MPIKRPPEPWNSFLVQVDAAVTQQVRLDCIGGFVVTQLYGIERETTDLDVLCLSPRSESARLAVGEFGGALHKKFGVHLDLRAAVAQMPEDYESRLVEMYPGAYAKLRLLALDPYDIALTKIERNSERDRQDVRDLARIIPFDLSILKQRYHDELRPYLNRREREDLTLELWIEAIEEDRAQRPV
jgi:hypothetical protein